MRNQFRMIHPDGRGRVAVSAVVALTLAGVLTACGLGDAAQQAVDEVASQAEDAVGGLSADAAAATVGAAVEQTLAEAGYTLTSPPTCTADLGADARTLGLTGEVACTGEVSTGETYEAVFDGLVTLTGRCPGSLRVEIMGDPEVALDRVDVCRIARLLEGA
jgi:hypothetical protein